MMGAGVPPSEASHSGMPDEVSILAGAFHRNSAGVGRAVQFIRPHALPDLDDADIRRIITGECFTVVGEVQRDWLFRQHVEKRNSEVLKDRHATLKAMHNLLGDLKDELDHCLAAQQKHKVDLRSDARLLSSAVKALQKSIVAVAELTQLEEEGRTRSAPNSKLFSAEYVRAVRRAWRRITGESPGVARTSVVDFAFELWEAVGLPDRGAETPTREWLAERFKNIR